MLAIPMMKSDPSIPVDFTGLASTLRNQACYPDELIIHDITRFDALRKQVLSITESSDVHYETYLTYLQQVKTLLPRIASIEAECKVVFTWHDAFAPSKKFTSSSFAWEMIASCWNLAALESLRGGRIDRSTDDGIRLANKHFQIAAGCFDYIKDVLLAKLPGAGNVLSSAAGVQGPTALPCMTVECLNMAKQLMLAQAQLCFYEKAVRDKKKELMKSTIVAKLAAQVSVYYTSASVSCRVGPISSLLDMSWYAITDFQAKCFHGAAEYWQAVASKEAALQKGSGYGEEVARYIRAEQFVRQALEQSKKYPMINATLIAGADALLQVISTNRQKAYQELNSIYMEAVPADGSLVDVPPVAMVKPSPLPEPSASTASPALFTFILPKEYIGFIRSYADEVNGMASRASVEAENATNLGRMTLNSVGLPGSLEAAKSDNPLPDGVWTKIAKIQGSGGMPQLVLQYDDMQKSAKRTLLTMANIEESLDLEDRKDEIFRQRFPTYDGMRSRDLNLDTRENVKTLRDAYSAAQSKDEMLRKDIFEDESFKLLTRSREDLLKLFPTPPVDLLDLEPPSGSNALSREGVQLEEKLHELAGIFEHRQQDVHQLQAFQQLNFSDIIQQAMNKNEDVTTLYHQHLQQARSFVQKVEEHSAQQEQLLQEILQLNDIFVKSKDSDPISIQRHQLIQSLEQQVVKYNTIQSQLTAGLTFYSNLQSKLTTLQQTADDSAFTQQWQRQEYEANQLQSSSSSNNVMENRDLASNFSSGVYITPPAASNSYGAYPTLQNPVTPAAPSAYVHSQHPSSGQYPGAISSPTPVVTVPAAAAPGNNTYSYNNQSYGIPAVQQAPQPSNQGQYPAMAVMGQPISGPPSSNGSVSPPPPPLPPKPLTAADMDAKVARMMEMGFARDAVTNALSSSNWNEELALNVLLSNTSSSAPAPVHNAAPAKPSGLFGSMWGSKK